jgi:S-adenosylmethionine/arginine decarboxylase-like enzyme
MIDYIAKFNEEEWWGMSTSVDIYGVDVTLISDENYLYEWIIDLVDYIAMDSYGEPLIVRFGQGNLEGYSVVQLIQTSCITAHFDEVNGVAYIDIFSCKGYNPDTAAMFCLEYFDGESYTINVTPRI